MLNRTLFYTFIHITIYCSISVKVLLIIHHIASQSKTMFNNYESLWEKSASIEPITDCTQEKHSTITPL